MTVSLIAEIIVGIFWIFALASGWVITLLDKKSLYYPFRIILLVFLTILTAGAFGAAISTGGK